MSAAEWMIYMVFTTEGFFEIAIESWPEWDLNPRLLNSVQTLWPTELSGHEFNSHSEPTLYSYSISSFVHIYIYPEKGHQINYIWINIIIKIRMEYQKIINLLDITPNQSSKFRTKNWFQINDDASLTYSTNSQIRF